MTKENEDRPIEPYSASESPERWEEIASWEQERADSLQKRLEEKEKHSNEAYQDLHDLQIKYDKMFDEAVSIRILKDQTQDKLNKAIEVMKDVIENYECGLEVDGKINTVLKEVEK